MTGKVTYEYLLCQERYLERYPGTIPFPSGLVYAELNLQTGAGTGSPFEAMSWQVEKRVRKSGLHMGDSYRALLLIIDRAYACFNFQQLLSMRHCYCVCLHFPSSARTSGRVDERGGIHVP